ncbi:Gldg family protein [Thermodesulfobacteriota bacterium]
MRGKDRSGTYIKFIIYFVVIVLVNIAGTTLFKRIDLTRNDIYSLSKVSKQVVSTLSEPMTINVFFTKDLPAPHNNTERYLRDLLDEYSFESNRFFNYRFYNVSTDEGDINKEARENRELANDYGIYPVQIQAVEKDEIKFQRAYMGLVLIHGDLIERIPTITSTDKLEYQLTTAIQKMNNKISALLGLKEKVLIKLYLSSSLEAVAPYMDLEDLPKLPEAVNRTVESLNQKNYGKLQFEYLDPAKDESLENKLDGYGIPTLSWPSVPKFDIAPGKGTIGLTMEFGDKVTAVPILQILELPLIGTRYQLVDMKNLEEIINKNLESLIGINEDIGYLADNGTFNIPGKPNNDPTQQMFPGSIANLNALLSQRYTINDFNLKDGSIPEGINCLLIARPTQKFSEYELFQIDQALMRGINLAIFTNAFNEMQIPNQPGMPPGSAQPPIYVPLESGLEKLLGHYGVSIKKSIVMDENCYKQQAQQNFGGGEISLYYAPIIQNKYINDSLDFMQNLKALVVAKISPLELNDVRITENGLKAHTLFSSSDRSWEMEGRINLNPMAIQPPQSESDMRSYPLAYLIEGEFPSYFAGKPVPKKETEDTNSEEKKEEKPEQIETGMEIPEIKDKGRVLPKGKPAKILLIASSEIINDNILDADGTTTNSMFVMNAIDALNNREGIAVMRSKENQLNPLEDTTAEIKTFIKFFNIVGLPILVAIFGLLVLFRRKSRRKSIQMMFQQ